MKAILCLVLLAVCWRLSESKAYVYTYNTGDAEYHYGHEEPKNCKMTTKGHEYAGSKYTHTKSGKICQMWDSQYPNKHTKKASNFPEKSLQKAKNFCRNPDNEPHGPWCYIGVPNQGRWEYCDVPFCKDGSGGLDEKSVSFLNGLHGAGGSSGKKERVNLVYTIEAKDQTKYLQVWEGILKSIKGFYIHPDHAVVTVFVYGNSIKKYQFTSFHQIANFIRSGIFHDFGARLNFVDVLRHIKSNIGFVNQHRGKKLVMTIVGSDSLNIKNRGLFNDLMKSLSRFGFHFSLIGVKGSFHLSPFLKFINKAFVVTVGSFGHIVGGILNLAGHVLGDIGRFVGTAVGAVLNGAGQIVGGAVQGVGKVVGGVVGGVGHAVGGLARGVGHLLGGLFG